MATRRIVERGDETLNKVCRPVTQFDDHLHQIIDDMRETLELSNGYGLAAPQVGILRRVCLVTDSNGSVIELINPELLETEGEQEGLEGCLSVPGLYGWVKRPYRVKVRAQNRDGRTFEVEDVEMSARCFCHEIEHLDGHLFTERVLDGKLYTEAELATMEEEQKSENRGRKKKGRQGGE